MAEKLKLDRELYRRIKGMDKTELTNFLEKIYAMALRTTVLTLNCCGSV